MSKKPTGRNTLLLDVVRSLLPPLFDKPAAAARAKWTSPPATLVLDEDDALGVDCVNVTGLLAEPSGGGGGTTENSEVRVLVVPRRAPLVDDDDEEDGRGNCTVGGPKRSLSVGARALELLLELALGASLSGAMSRKLSRNLSRYDGFSAI